MYGQSMYRLANSRFASIDSRVSSGLPTISAADDEQAVAVQMLDRLDGRVADGAAVLAAHVLGAAPSETARSSSSTFSMPRNT